MWVRRSEAVVPETRKRIQIRIIQAQTISQNEKRKKLEAGEERRMVKDNVYEIKTVTHVTRGGKQGRGGKGLFPGAGKASLKTSNDFKKKEDF